jgi:alkane 1-monooxygenase
MIYAWILLPLAELFIKPTDKNLTAAEEELAKKDRLYDFLLYIIVPVQFITLYYFLTSMRTPDLLWWEVGGRTWSMGLLCGSFGINVAHELGHRTNKFEQFFSKALLLTSLYMHFYIEHNKGHHKNVATPADPASARYNEPVYAFYFRTIIFSYLSAWKIANSEMKKKGLPVLHWKNEMLQAQVIQLFFITAILFMFGWLITFYFVNAAVIGFLLLETVNYIEHYGLQRKQRADGNYERAMPQHSWNSNHILGRLMLFELSRHSDHHYLASKKYQVLRHHDEAPQLPTGYPGSMILAMFPPLWFHVMNKKIRELAPAE